MSWNIFLFCNPRILDQVVFYFLRYECPAGCLDSKAKVIGSVHYEMVNISKLDSAPVVCLMKYFSVGMLVKNGF